MFYSDRISFNASVAVSFEQESPQPTGCFDYGEGYYDPKKLSICSFETADPTRVPSKEEKEFIVKNCRKGL